MRLDRLAETCLGPAVMRHGFSSTQVIAAWSDVVGPELAARTRPERIRWPARRDDSPRVAAATLVIRAEGLDALELQHMSGAIVARVNTIFGWRAIGRVSIRQAPVEKAGDAEPACPPAGLRDSPGLRAVPDPELRAALARLGAGIAAENAPGTVDNEDTPL